MTNKEWPLYEVFIRSRSGLSHRHAGSVHAADDEMALTNARDTYTRRNEGVSIWVVRSSQIVASDPAETVSGDGAAGPGPPSSAATTAMTTPMATSASTTPTAIPAPEPDRDPTSRTEGSGRRPYQPD